MKKDHAIREGLSAMVLDLSVQMCRTIGIYAAGSRMGMGAMYQISTLESSFPQFGLQYIAGLTLAFRIFGAQPGGVLLEKLSKGMRSEPMVPLPPRVLSVIV